MSIENWRPQFGIIPGLDNNRRSTRIVKVGGGAEIGHQSRRRSTRISKVGGPNDDDSDDDIEVNDPAVVRSSNKLGSLAEPEAVDLNKGDVGITEEDDYDGELLEVTPVDRLEGGDQIEEEKKQV